MPSNLDVSFGDFLFSQRKKNKALKVISMFVRSPSQISCFFFFFLVSFLKDGKARCAPWDRRCHLADHQGTTRSSLSLPIQNLVLPSTTSSEFHKLFLKTFMVGFPFLTSFLVILPVRICHTGKEK